MLDPVGTVGFQFCLPGPGCGNVTQCCAVLLPCEQGDRRWGGFKGPSKEKRVMSVRIIDEAILRLKMYLLFKLAGRV